MDPREFQQLASKLILGASVSEFRTAISRAYYATYNVGVEILVRMGFQIGKGPGGHGDVWKRLSNSGHTEVEKVGSQLNDLRSKRIQADYRLNDQEVENQKTAQAIVEQANRMIKTLDECCSGSRCAQIVSAIREWERQTGSRR